MIRYFGQPKFSAQHTAMGCELFLREFEDGKWVVPTDFSKFTAAELFPVALATISALPEATKLVSINLDQNQFILPEFIALMINLHKRLTDVTVVVELTEYHYATVTPDELVAAACDYHKAGVWVCLDDVGFGDNTLNLAIKMEAFTDEYKFPLQNFRHHEDFKTIIRPELARWHQAAVEHHKFFAVEGIETSCEVDIIDQYHPDVTQGYYLGMPGLIKY